MARFALLILLVASASALVAHAPVLRAARAPVSRAAASPQMMLGSGSIGKAVRAMKLPSFPKGIGRRGGIIRGSDGGDGAPPADGTSSSSSDDDSRGGFDAVWGKYNALLEEKGDGRYVPNT